MSWKVFRKQAGGDSDVEHSWVVPDRLSDRLATTGMNIMQLPIDEVESVIGPYVLPETCPECEEYIGEPTIGGGKPMTYCPNCGERLEAPIERVDRPDPA